MIFVCVGSREYQFNRLIREIDSLIERKILKEEVFGQIGNSSYRPSNFEFVSFLSSQKFMDYQSKASLIVSHGGTGALISSLKMNKQVVAVPRLEKFGEHIDDHQIQITDVLTREGYLKSVKNIKDLGSTILELKVNPINKVFSKQSNIVDIIENYIKVK